MKKVVLLSLLIVTSIVAQTPCDGNIADGFPCDNYDLMATLSVSQMDAASGNDSWGWTDASTGKEYALMGLNNGTAFVDITDPVNIIYLGKLPTHNNVLDGGQIWRDVKVFNNHAFIVSEIDGHGMQVFDLTRLRNVTNPPETFTEDAHYDGFGNAHNIAINEDTGFAYALGTQTFNGGVHFIDISNPTNPIAAGGYGGSNYCHDAQIVVYNGPDGDHTGKEILVGSNTDEVVIVDVSTKNAPVLISSVSYSDEGYTHQGWFTEDQRYFIVNDEADEVVFGFNTRTIVFDFSDLDAPSFKFDVTGPTPATDHNLYVHQNRAYMANYSEGMRVIDVSDLANNIITPVGDFDTFPENNISGTDNGIWSLYPFFESGNIFLSDYNRGLFIVRESNTLNINESGLKSFSLAPNPAKDVVNISVENLAIDTIEIYDITGKQVIQETNLNTVSKTITVSELSSGLYLVKVNGNVVTKLVKK